jgi:hypothetical protein
MTFFGATLLSAIATVVLAVFAIVTAGYARRAFIKQSQEIGILLEESERDKAERRMAQAARVFLAADPDAVRLVRPYVKNASDFPVYDARISYTDLDDTADREYLGMIMPSGTRSAAREFSSDLDALDCTSVTFRDAAGVWWTRMPRGELRDESFPAALSGASLAAAFERVTGRRISHRGATRRLPPAEAQSVASPPPAHRPERLVAGKLPVGRRVDGHALSSATMAPANDLQLRGLHRGVRSSLVPARKPSTRPGWYCILRSRVFARAVSWAMSRLARLARERFRWDQTDSTGLSSEA